MKGTLIAQVEDVRVVESGPGEKRFAVECENENALGELYWCVDKWTTDEDIVVIFAKKIQELEALVKTMDKKLDGYR